MGLENGIVLERTDKIISAEDMRVFNEYFSDILDDFEEFTLCYWKNQVRIRSEILSLFHDRRDEYDLNIDMLRQICNICIDILIDEDVEGFSSYRIESETKSICVALAEMETFIKKSIMFEYETGLNVEDFVDIYFYDSY